MNARERVLAALRHEKPDRAPLDLGGTESSGITGIAYNRLRRHLGLPQGRTEIFDVYQQICKLEDDLRAELAPDTVPLLLEPQAWQPWRLPDGSPCHIPAKWNPRQEPDGDWVVPDDTGTVIARLPRDGFYFEPVNPPLADVENATELDRFRDTLDAFDWPAFADEPLEQVAERGRKLHEETDRAVVANLQLHLLAAGQLLRGFENFIVDLLVNKDLAHAILERLTEAYVARCDRYLAQVGNHVDVVLVNDDLGTQNGPMLSLECYKEMIWPYQERLFRHIKQRADTFILFHSCGAVRAFIPHLVEAGVDALNPVQVSAAGMDTASLKREFGRDITFWGGGCDTQQVLAQGPPARIREEVKRRIGDLAPGGGFVFTQVHNIQPDVPPQNIMAMFEAYRESCEY